MNKNEFKIVFGINANELKDTVIITPFMNRKVMDAFGITQLSKGVLYSVGSNESFSVVVTGIGATFLGDAVLYLEQTNASKLIMFGACGAIDTSLEIGSLILVKEVAAQDSFIGMLKNLPADYLINCENDLFLSLQEKNNELIPVSCMTVGSLKLEKEYFQSLGESSLQVVDMETAAFFHAAEAINKQAAAFHFISDIVGKVPYYHMLEKEHIEQRKEITSQSALCLKKILYT